MKNKILTTLILSIVSFFSVVSNVQAEDMRITCQGGGPCSIDFGSPLFNVASFAPGESLIRQIVAINKDGADSCDLTLYTHKKNYTTESDLFAAKLFTAIRSESATLYGVPDGNTATGDKSFKSLLDYGGALSLGNVPTNSESKINWIVTFDPISDNTYQSKTLNFDFDISFVCGSQGGGAGTTPTPSPVLGASTYKKVLSVFIESPEPSSTPSETTTSEVKGIECVELSFPWWVPLLVEAILLASYVLYLKKAKINNRRWVILPLVLAIASQAIHEILGCGCISNSSLCSKYLFINLALLAITYIIKRLPIASQASKG